MRSWRLRLILLILLSAAPAWSATYYVDFTTGLDSDSGLTEALAWKTLVKVRGRTFQPGDSILFKRGETWTAENLTFLSSGTAAAPILYGAYGTGNRPVINAAKPNPQFEAAVNSFNRQLADYSGFRYPWRSATASCGEL